MSLLTYMRARVSALAIAVATAGSLAGVSALAGVQRDLCLLLALLVILGFAATGTLNYLRVRRWCAQLRAVAAAPRDAPELAACLPPPEQPEDLAAYEALRAVAGESAQRAAQAALRARDHREFVEAWVHEVKTPLAAADLMLQNRADPCLAPLRRELDRVGAYVEQALFYARSSSVENDYLVRACRLDDLVREAVKSRAHALVEARMAVRLEGLGLTVYADAKWVVFIVGQLVDNALRYRRPHPAQTTRASGLASDPGPAEKPRALGAADDPGSAVATPGAPSPDGAPDSSSRSFSASPSPDEVPTVAFTARVLDAGRATERTVLSVRDNGRGVPLADQPRVFEKGFTGANGRAFQKSTGIGLYLVRTLCHKMGCAVSLTSEPGAWTCVDIVFPANRTHLLTPM